MHDLRRLRISANMTLDQASDGICSTSYLSLIEQGKREPGARILNALSERYATLGAGLTQQQIDFYVDLEQQVFDRYPSAIRAVKALKEDNPVVDYLNAICDAAEGNYYDAISTFRRVLPNKLSRLFGLKAGIALVRLLKQTGQMAESAMAFEFVNATFIDQMEAVPYLKIELYANGVWPLLELGANHRAMEIATEAVALTESENITSFAFADWAMADVATQKQNFELAADHLGKALKHAQNNRADNLTYALETQLAVLQLEAGTAQANDVIGRLPVWQSDIERYRLKYAENCLFLVKATAYSLAGDEAKLNEAADGYLVWRKVFDSQPDVQGVEGFVKAFLRLKSDRVQEFLALAEELGSTNGKSFISAGFWYNMCSYYEQIGDTAKAYRSLKNMAAAAQLTDGLKFDSSLLG